MTLILTLDLPKVKCKYANRKAIYATSYVLAVVLSVIVGEIIIQKLSQSTLLLSFRLKMNVKNVDDFAENWHANLFWQHAYV